MWPRTRTERSGGKNRTWGPCTGEASVASPQSVVAAVAARAPRRSCTATSLRPSSPPARRYLAIPSFPRHKIVPGAGAFYYQLSRGVNSANRNLFVIHARAWRWAHLAARVCVCVGLAAMASPVQSPRGSNPMKSPRGSNPMKSPRQMEGKKTWQVMHNHRPLSPYSLSQTSLPLTLSQTSMGGRGRDGAAAAHPCAARGASMCGPRDRARAHAPAAADPVRRSLLPAPSCVRRLAGDKDFVGRRGSCQRW